MRRLTLTEYETTTGVELSAEEVRAIQRTGARVIVVPSLVGGGLCDLTPSSRIGAINLGTLAIEIRPKLPIDRVLFLLAYSLDSAPWQDTGFDFAERRSLVEAIVHGFCHQLRRAVGRGLLHGYCTEEAALPTIRGRIRFDDQIRDRFGSFPPCEVRYDEFTDDIEENRILKAAILRLTRLRLRSEIARKSLRHYLFAFEDVRAVDYHPEWLPQITYTRLNRHYRPAVELAKLILRSTSFDLGHGGVRSSCFLVDMNDLFEDFVVVALRQALGLSLRVFPQGARGKCLCLDGAAAVRVEPDISWWDGQTCTFVGDVKYKRVNASGIEHSDIYQLLAYTIAANLPGGLLVYAAGEAEPVVHQVVHVGKHIEVVTLDLRGSPDEILGQIKGVAQGIRQLRAKVLEGIWAA